MDSSGGICSFSFDLRLTELTDDDDQQSNAKPVGKRGRASNILEREILDWNRFKNPRQVASLTGSENATERGGARKGNKSRAQPRTPEPTNQEMTSTTSAANQKFPVWYKRSPAKYITSTIRHLFDKPISNSKLKTVCFEPA